MGAARCGAFPALLALAICVGASQTGGAAPTIRVGAGGSEVVVDLARPMPRPRVPRTPFRIDEPLAGHPFRLDDRIAAEERRLAREKIGTAIGRREVQVLRSESRIRFDGLQPR